MSEIRNLHRDAMALADQAFMARRQESYEQAESLFSQAYELEFFAAQNTQKEPSRSVLYRSAATMALHAKRIDDAERAAAIGLSGNPPSEIRAELREVIEKISFESHLKLQGVELNPSELQMTIVGNAVAAGLAPTEMVFERVQSFETLVIRTAQRLNKRPFGKMPSRENLYSVYMSPPRSGSFAITLRLGKPDQLTLPGFVDNYENLIDELLYNLDLLNQNRFEDLKHVIDNDAYYESFVLVSKRVVPDGDNVKLVGVTAQRGKSERSVGLTVRSKDIKPNLTHTDKILAIEDTTEIQRITGTLLFANAIRNKNQIRVIDDNDKIYTINVSQAISEDVVKPYFGNRVTVDVSSRGGKLIFSDINLSEA